MRKNPPYHFLAPLSVSSWLIASLAALICGATGLSGAIITQTTTTSSSQSWNTAAIWSNNEAPSLTNDYVVQGLSLRSPNVPTGSATFGGGSLLIESASSVRGVLNLKTGTITVADLRLAAGSISNGVNNGVSNLAATVNLTNFTVAAGATQANSAIITGSNSGNNVTLNVGNLLGTGFLSFGKGSGNTLNYSLSVTDASGFSGDIDLSRGNLTVASLLDLGLSDFTMATTNTTLTLGGNVKVASFGFGASLLDAGEYTSTSLNTMFSTTVFSGGGTLMVVPEPASAALLGVGILVLVARRRRRVRE